MNVSAKKIDEFALAAGDVIGDKYVVQRLLGAGWEGEVYEVRERRTGVHRAAKLFFPKRNVRDHAVRYQARKLEHLRQCSMVIQYMHSETVAWHDTEVTCLISELVEAELLSALVAGQPGKRLGVFEALCLVHALATGIEEIHDTGAYHGDLHSHNVLVARRGIRFDVKLLDFFPRGAASAQLRREDVIDVVHLLHEAVGGRPRYAGQPTVIKQICCGLRSDLIARSFPSARALRLHLESFAWE